MLLMTPTQRDSGSDPTQNLSGLEFSVDYLSTTFGSSKNHQIINLMEQKRKMFNKAKSKMRRAKS